MAALLGCLEYDKRDNGSHGRALISDFAGLGLLKGDRVEPTLLCPDVSAVEAIRTFPCELLFWRPSRATVAKHRNPLLGARTGISLSSFCIDEMHTMHLGVLQSFVVTALWRLILEDVWGFGEHGPQEAAHQQSALRIRHELFQGWYPKVKRENPGKPVYELADFRLADLGSKENPVLKTKAAETGELVPFAASLLRKHQTSLQNGACLVGAGEALVEHLRITRAAGSILRAGGRQRLMDAALRFLSLCEASGIPYKPKMHMLLHLVHQCERFGNPRHVATWFDEGLNRTLAQVAASAHAAVWHRRVLATFRSQCGPSTQPTKKQRA